MAFSGSQKTRLGLAAFARSLYGSFSGKTEAIVTPGVGLGVSTNLFNSGIGGTGAVANVGFGATGTITLGYGKSTNMTNNGAGGTGKIVNDGIGETGAL